MIWKETVDIKQVLNSDDIPDNLKPGRIASIIAKAPAFKKTTFAKELRAYNGKRYNQRAVNSILSRLYDWADINHVWMGV